MGVYGTNAVPTQRDPELAALQADLDRLVQLERKDQIKQEVARLKAKYGEAREPTIDDRMKTFWESKGIKVTDVRANRRN